MTEKEKKESESEEPKPSDSDANTKSDGPEKNERWMDFEEAVRRGLNTPPIPTKDIPKPSKPS